MLDPRMRAKAPVDVSDADLDAGSVAIARQQAMERERLRQARGSRDEPAGRANRPFEAIQTRPDRSGNDRSCSRCGEPIPGQYPQRDSDSNQHQKRAAEHSDAGRLK